MSIIIPSTLLPKMPLRLPTITHTITGRSTFIRFIAIFLLFLLFPFFITEQLLVALTRRKGIIQAPAATV